VWEDLRVETTEVRDFGETVLATGRVIARGKASGVGLDRSWSFLFRLRDGKVLWHRNFLDPAEARRAAELPDVP
jgi:ketosteroid isomerase-like protein